MIRIAVTRQGEHITHWETSGHAEYAEKGEDLVCAAVSAIVFGLLNACSETDPQVCCKVEENRITIDHSSGNEVIDHFLTCALYQVKTIEESYPVFVRVLERRPDEV